MNNKIIVSRRRTPLVVIEILITAFILSVWLYKKYHWDWIIGVLLFFGISAFISALFFGVRLFRYIISILFSFFWAIIAYSFATGLTKSKLSPWLAAGVIFILCIAAHKGYFDFETNATRIKYDDR